METTGARRRLSRWWLDRSIRTKGLIVLAVPLTVLTAVIATGMALQLQERRVRQISVAGNNLMRGAAKVLTDSVDAETGMRGYAATGDPAFLAPYTVAVAVIPTDLRILTDILEKQGDSPSAVAVTSTVTAQFELLGRMRAAIASGSPPASLFADVRDGKVLMDELRGQIARLVETPSNMLLQRRAAITRLESRILTVGLVGLAFGVIAGLIGMALFSSGISGRVRTAADHAGRLGRGEPITRSAPSHDELGRLGDSLAAAELVLTERLLDLAAARDQAVAANASKNSFLSRTSHELRTPLNAILGFAQLLELADLAEEDRDSTSRILGAGRHLLSLINELIDIARVESGDLGLSVEPVRLAELVGDTAALMQPLAVARGIAIETEVEDAALSAYADRQRLRQIMINLASNAIKYNHPGGLIRVTCRAGAQGEVELAVTDTGPGLSAEDQVRIFLPFERLGAERQGIEGTGIGLPLAMALAEAMHAQLRVTSTLGHGSTFTVLLRPAPALPSSPEPDSVPPPAPRATSDRDLVLLSIEDNPANSELLARLFRDRPGTALHAAISGQAGLDLAARHRPDVILLDLHLPDISGEEVLDRLLAQPELARIPVIVLSADATRGTIRRLRARGIAGYLTKPLDLHELDDILDGIVPGPATSEPEEITPR